MQKKVIFFDLDGTLTPHSTWKELNLLLGITAEEDHALFLQYLDGNFEYKAWTTELVRLYKSRKVITKEQVVELANNIELRPDAAVSIAVAREKDYHTVLISGSVDTIVETISKKVGTDAWLACSKLLFNENNQLVDIGSTDDEAPVKALLAEAYAEAQGFHLPTAYVVGDGGNERDLFHISKGILLGNNEELKPLAWKQVGSLSEISELL